MSEEKSEALQQLGEQLKDLQSQTEEKERRVSEAEAKMSSLEKQNAELQNVAQLMKKEAEVKYSLFSFVMLCYYISSCRIFP